MDLNQFHLIGRLTRDAEIKSTPILLLMTFFKMLYKFYMRIFHSGIIENIQE